MAKKRFTTKAQREAILKDLGLTAAEMDEIWKGCVEVNWKCKMIADNNNDWTNLVESQIRELPTLREKTLKQIEEKKKTEEAAKDAEKKKKEEEKYYEENFESIMLDKISNREPLTERELSRLVYEHEYDVEYGDDERWTRHVTSIVKIKDKYFQILWQKGLTESQEDVFMDQPVEVRPHIYEKTIVVTEWKKV